MIYEGWYIIKERKMVGQSKSNVCSLITTYLKVEAHSVYQNKYKNIRFPKLALIIVLSPVGEA